MEKLGLVLAGGGGKGAYHIGVWKALKEYGVDNNISCLSGTSIGALNAVLFAMGDYDLAERLWMDITADKVLSLDTKKILLSLAGLGLGGISAVVLGAMSSAGIFTREGLIEILDNKLNLSFLSHSERKIFAGAYNVSRFRMEYLELSGCGEERAKKIMLATSALPIIYPPVVIDGKRYIDGGVMDNVPIEPLYDEGCRNLLVIHLSRDSMATINKYKDARILEIVPSEDQGDFLDGTMDFTTEGVIKRIDWGYRDTVKILKPLYEMGIVQNKIGETLEKMRTDELEFKNKHSQLMRENEEIMSEREILKKQLMDGVKDYGRTHNR